MSTDLTILCVTANETIRVAIQRIDQNQKGIVLVTTPEGKLMGTITDGDIRRAMLASFSLDDKVDSILRSKRQGSYSTPTTAPEGTASKELLDIMQTKMVRQIPLLNKQGNVVDLVLLDELLPKQQSDISAVIMAGGKGTRLRPFTEDVPKPMLPVGDKPIMEHIIEQLKSADIKNVNITTNYLSDKIKDYFQDGSQLGMQLEYVTEDQPLGTAGSLRLMEEKKAPFLVINGDILHKVDYRAMYDFHRENQAVVTVAVREYDFSVPYGVIETEGAQVRDIVEKPKYSFFVNAGIYLLEPEVRSLIPENQYFDMTDLIKLLIKKGQKVASFPIHEYWLDVGRPSDYAKAQQDFGEKS